MAISFVQIIAARGDRESHTPLGDFEVAVNGGVNAPAGELAVAFVSFQGTAATPTLVDNKGNTYTAATRVDYPSGVSVLGFYCRLTAALNAADTPAPKFTVSVNESYAVSLLVLQFSGVPATFFVDEASDSGEAASGWSNEALTTGSLGISGETLFVGGFAVNQDTGAWSFTPDTGWTTSGEANSHDSSASGLVEASTVAIHRIETTGGPYTAGGTLSNPSSWDMYWAGSHLAFSTVGPPEGAGTADAVSTATGNGTVEHLGAGTADAVGTASALGGFDNLGAGAADAVSTTAGNGSADIPGAGLGEGVTTTAGAGIQIQPAAGAAAGVSTATANGGFDLAGAGTADAVSTTAGRGGFDVDGAGTADAVSTATGLGGFDNPGAGTSDAVSTTAGAGVQTQVGAGLGTGVSTATAYAVIEILASGRADGKSATRRRNMPGTFAVVEPVPTFRGGFEAPS